MFITLWAGVLAFTPPERPVVYLEYSGQHMTPEQYGRRVEGQLEKRGYRDLCVEHLAHVYYVVHEVGVEPDDLSRWTQATEIIGVCRARTALLGKPRQNLR